MGEGVLTGQKDLIPNTVRQLLFPQLEQREEIRAERMERALAKRLRRWAREGGNLGIGIAGPGKQHDGEWRGNLVCVRFPFFYGGNGLNFTFWASRSAPK